MKGIKVRLYNSQTGERHTLGEVPFESIDRVIPTIKHWGLEDSGDFADSDSYTGTFMFNEDGAYFEVSFE